MSQQVPSKASSDVKSSQNSTSRREKWDARYAAKELVWSAGPNALLEQEVSGLEPGAALDVACGEGRNALWLAEQGWRVTGIDFSTVGLDKARRAAEQRGVEADWLAEDVASYPLPEQGFDLVCVLFLHTDPEERGRWLANVVSAVKPGGVFLYIGHDPQNVDHGVGGPQDPQFLPSAEEISSALDGFRVETACVHERTVVSDPGHSQSAEGIALDTFVRAVRLE
jgi:SAM-dependent methyltransferase